MPAILITAPRNSAEIDAMWHFNHTVFAAELGMRECRADARLIDKFHEKNLYRLAIESPNGTLVGMIAAHCQAPYSASAHFGAAVTATAPGEKLGEIRLYAVAPEWRRTPVCARLGIAVFEALAPLGVTDVVISGISVQKKFYEHLGFAAVGKPVICGATELYPMRGRLAILLDRCRRIQHRFSQEIPQQPDHAD